MNGENFSLEENGKGKYNLTLGNMSNAGWYWNGKEDEALGFLIRLAHSDTKEEFLQKAEKEGVSWDDFKPLLLKAAKKKDGLYELSGDNQMWHFGETYADSLYEAQHEHQRELEENGWTKEDAEKESEAKLDHTKIEYDDFEKEYGSEYTEAMEKLIKESKSFKDFIDELNSESFSYDWAEHSLLYPESVFYNAPGDKNLEKKYKKKLKN